MGPLRIYEPKPRLFPLRRRLRIVRILANLFLWSVVVSAPAATLPTVVWKTNVHFTIVSSVRFRPDGSSVASGSYSGPAKLWSTTDGTLLNTFNYGGLDIVAVAFSANGTHLFGGSGTGPCRVWQVSNGAPAFSNPAASAGFGTVTYSANGLFLALGREFGTISLQDAVTGSGIRLLEGHEGMVGRVEFSPDSTLLASSGSDDTAKLWRVSDGALLQNFDYAGGAIAFTPDGKYFCYDKHDGTAAFWDVQTNGIARIFPAWGGAVRFTANGKILVTVNGPLVNLWRVSTGALLASYDISGNGGALCLDVSSDARFFAYGNNDGSVILARMPVTLDTITRTGNETILHWQGGSGLYQLQSTHNFTTNGWQNVGSSTTNTCATNVSPSTLFFRVQSLPNP